MINEVLLPFIIESNRIEGIKRPPTEEEIIAAHTVMDLDHLILKDILYFVGVYEPTAQLRDRKGLNVTVGNHFPPAGDITVKTRLLDLLQDVNSRKFTPYELHVRYELLHPFTDCNGRSGRIIWRWMMREDEVPLGFLHTWYYQSLRAARTT